ncbi:MAG: 16S rRNA (cytosine(1402)-N(4))-methyltransferase RsmH [Ignavibacteriae bacterium]|nr:16S rRNA (cytosine(1402)-N(4))-methyltransferase RsmH [Ignavibacteriota bacterium]
MTHDPTDYHIPVLLESAVELLVTDAAGTYVDGTLGGGGHSERILERLDAGGRLVGLDQDADAIVHASRRLAHDSRFLFVRSNTVHLQSVLENLNLTAVNGILLDLGMSSRQIDAPERGFSFQHDGPLDMRMDRSEGIPGAADLLAHADKDELQRIFFTYGEERRSRRIADAIIRARTKAPILTTNDLAAVVRAAAPGPHTSKTLARIFQALRIAVNDELRVLETILDASLNALGDAGRLVVISYHSLEDRMVKLFLRRQSVDCVCPPRTPICVCGTIPRMKVLTHSPKVPDDDEIRRNPRSRSARLRAGQKIHA